MWKRVKKEKKRLGLSGHLMQNPKYWVTGANGQDGTPPALRSFFWGEIRGLWGFQPSSDFGREMRRLSTLGENLGKGAFSPSHGALPTAFDGGGGEARPRTRNALMLPPRSPTAGHPPDSCLWFVERSGGVEKGVVGRQIWLDSEKEPKSDIELLGELQRRSCRNAVDEPCIPSFMCEF
jgi:hypothetical protein